MRTTTQDARVDKAMKEIRMSPGYQDLRRFVIAEASEDKPDPNGLIDELTEKFNLILHNEYEAAVEGKRKRGV